MKPAHLVLQGDAEGHRRDLEAKERDTHSTRREKDGGSGADQEDSGGLDGTRIDCVGESVQASPNLRKARWLIHTSRGLCNLTLPFVPLALPKARPEEVNMDYYRNYGTERCHCDSDADTRNVHNAIHVRGRARSLIAQNMTQDILNEKEFNSDDAVAFG